MTNIFNNPWDEERQRRLLAPPIGVRPYQSNLSPGQMYGKFSSGSGGITPLPSPMPKIGPAPLPPGMQPDYGGGQIINLPELPDNPGYNIPHDQPGYSGIATMDIVNYYNVNTGETTTGPSYGAGLGDEWQRQPENGFSQPGYGGVQGPPETRFSPPGPPGYITPLPSPPNAGTGGPLPPGGGINRPSRPSNPPDYRLALPHPGIGRPNNPPTDRPIGQLEPGGGSSGFYQRATTSSASPSPAWGIGKTKRKFGT